MSQGRNQYAVYRLRDSPDYLQTLRHQPYQTWLEQNRRVTSDLYEPVFLARLDPKMEMAELRRQLETQLPAGGPEEPLAVSDVLAVTKEGISRVYYVDPDRLIVLTGFFRPTSPDALISIETTDYQIEGRPGIWLAAEEIWIDGQQFFLMQSQEFGEKAGFAVLDSQGRQAAQDTAVGFSDEIIRQIREYMQRKINNIPQKPLRRHKSAGRRKNGKLPLKGRESVLKRLKQYQAQLESQRGPRTAKHEEQGAIEHKQ